MKKHTIRIIKDNDIVCKIKRTGKYSFNFYDMNDKYRQINSDKQYSETNSTYGFLFSSEDKKFKIYSRHCPDVSEESKCIKLYLPGCIKRHDKQTLQFKNSNNLDLLFKKYLKAKN